MTVRITGGDAGATKESRPTDNPATRIGFGVDRRGWRCCGIGALLPLAFLAISIVTHAATPWPQQNEGQSSWPVGFPGAEVGSHTNQAASAPLISPFRFPPFIRGGEPAPAPASLLMVDTAVDPTEPSYLPNNGAGPGLCGPAPQQQEQAMDAMQTGRPPETGGAPREQDSQGEDEYLASPADGSPAETPALLAEPIASVAGGDSDVTPNDEEEAGRFTYFPDNTPGDRSPAETPALLPAAPPSSPAWEAWLLCSAPDYEELAGQSYYPNQLTDAIAAASELTGVSGDAIAAVLYKETGLCHYHPKSGKVTRGDQGRARGVGQIHDKPWRKYWSYNASEGFAKRSFDLDVLEDNVLICGLILKRCGWTAGDVPSQYQAYAEYNGGPDPCQAAKRYAAAVRSLQLAIARSAVGSTAVSTTESKTAGEQESTAGEAQE